MNIVYQTADYLRGYHHLDQHYHCLYCDFHTEEGVVYPDGERLLTAEKMITSHLDDQHGGPLFALLGLPKEQTGLSETQQEIIQLFAKGVDDKMISQRLGITPSTVRNHRFKLKEKEKQARILLSIMTLLDQPDIPLPHVGATMLDDRYDLTEKERHKILATYLDEKGRIITFPAKEKRKLVILANLVRHFDPQKNYSEEALNTILKQYAEDYVTLRRYLIEYGFMDRTKDGQSYWVK